MDDTTSIGKSKVLEALEQLGANIGILEGHLYNIYSMLKDFMKPVSEMGISGSTGVSAGHKDRILNDIAMENMKVVMMGITAKSIIDRLEL